MNNDMDRNQYKADPADCLTTIDMNRLAISLQYKADPQSTVTRQFFFAFYMMKNRKMLSK